MKARRRIMATVAIMLGVAGCATHAATEQREPAQSNVPIIKIYKHAAWGEVPPKGVEADGIRRNLAPGDSTSFREVTLTVTEMLPAASEAETDRVTLSLVSGDKSDTRTVNEGDAFNWNDYHISIIAIYMKRGELGLGSSAIEIATIKSLPKEIAQSTTANGPAYRLRVRHTLDKLTLHHSATAHHPGDDLGQKLRNMQSWGESDRNWFDIPYHFMVDLDGTVFEARDFHYVGDTNTRYDPTGHFLVNCFGSYSEIEPNEAQLATIANLFAWAAAEYEIAPGTIFGHRDLAQTSCPGDKLYRYIEDGTLSRMVTEVLAKGQPEMVWTDKMEGRE